MEKYGYGKRQTQLLETPIQLELEETMLKKPPSSALSQRVADLMDGSIQIKDVPQSSTTAAQEVLASNISSSTIMKPTITEQKVSIAKNGKKRIQPISLMPSPATTTTTLIPKKSMINTLPVSQPQSTQQTVI